MLCPSDHLDLGELRDFGLLADRLGYPDIAVGGFIVPGDGSSREFKTRGKESYAHGQGQGQAEEARPATGARQGRRTSSAAGSRAAAHAVRDRVSQIAKLEELEEYYPDTRIHSGSSGFALLETEVGIFRSLPYRAHLYFEVPLEGISPREQSGIVLEDRPLSTVPDVRAWALWDGGVLVRAYHQYPDYSICAFSPGQWCMDDGLKHYAHWCVCWLGKLLHLRLLDRWPGPQHCTAEVAVKRNKPDEYCRCGNPCLWRHCHMERDLARSPLELRVDAHRGQQAYLRELQQRAWPACPPWSRKG